MGYGVDRRRAWSEIQLLKELHWPDSLGLLYSAFTYYTGFKVNSGEYKVMGLAPYGVPKYVGLIYKELMDLHEDGSFTLNQKYFNYLAGLDYDERGLQRALRWSTSRAGDQAHPEGDGSCAVGSGRLRGSDVANGSHLPSRDRIARPLLGRRSCLELRR